MSEKAKRLAQEIQRNALKRMSRTGQGMTSQEEALLNFAEEQARKRDLWEMENRLYKPLDEVVDFICQYMNIQYPGDEVKKHQDGPVAGLMFYATQSSKSVDKILAERRDGTKFYVDVVEKKRVAWGKVSLVARDEVVFFEKTLHIEGMRELWGKDFIGYEKDKIARQNVLDDLKAKLLRLFGDKPKHEKPEPAPPPAGSDVFAWLDYRREYKESTGKKMTYKMLYKKSGFSIGTFEQASRKWKNERGIT